MRDYYLLFVHSGPQLKSVNLSYTTAFTLEVMPGLGLQVDSDIQAVAFIIMETLSLFFKIFCKEKEHLRVGLKQLKAWRRSWNNQCLRGIPSAQSLDTRELEDILCG